MTVLILSVMSLPSKCHLYLKGNDITSRYAVKPTATDLVFLFSKLKTALSREEAAESVARFLLFPPFT